MSSQRGVGNEKLRNTLGPLRVIVIIDARIVLLLIQASLCFQYVIFPYLQHLTQACWGYYPNPFYTVQYTH